MLTIIVVSHSILQLKYLAIHSTIYKQDWEYYCKFNNTSTLTTLEQNLGTQAKSRTLTSEAITAKVRIIVQIAT